METLDYLKKAADQFKSLPDDFPARMCISIVTDFTDDILKNIFSGALLSEDIYPTVYKVPYRQYHFELKDPSSGLYAANSEVTFMCFSMNPFKDSELRMSRDHFEGLLGDIERYAAATKGTVVVNSFVMSYRSAYGIMPERGPFFALVRDYNQRLGELASRVPNIVILDTNRIVHGLGELNVFDMRGLYAFDLPFTHAFMTALAEEWAAYTRALIGRIKKCIVVDLDNTLWGGVVGELGPTGIALGPDYPGNAFMNFQRALLDFYNRGIVLAIASKNNPEDVEEVFRSNPYMVLKERHFAAMRIGWGDKAENIMDMARELNIGAESMVFIDDDPLNRTMVRERLPGVSVPEFSLPPEEYARALYDLDLFTQLSLTEEDLQRGKMYADERQRKKTIASAKSIDEYVAELGIAIRVSKNEQPLIPRISQLTLKTNQFNLTTRRYTEHDIHDLIKRGALVFSGEVSDKFGDYGTVVVAIVVPDRTTEYEAVLDTFLMSCRVMGRNVECAFMDYVAHELHARNIRKLHAEFIPTAKNKPTETFLSDHGFAAEAGMRYVLDIPAYAAKPCPKVNKAVTINT